MKLAVVLLAISPWMNLRAETRPVLKIVSKDSAGTVVAAALVDTHDARDLADWGRRAGGLCVEWLPKIAAMLPSDGFAPAKEVTLVFDPKMNGVAATTGTRITIAADWVRKHPDDFGMVIHELTHVVQDYRGKGEGWLTEGIADYIRYWRFEPGARQFTITPGKSDYHQGYGVAGAFLDWLERTKHGGIVIALNAASRHGGYKPDLFAKLCGEDLDSLWRKFVEASAKK